MGLREPPMSATPAQAASQTRGPRDPRDPREPTQSSGDDTRLWLLRVAKGVVVVVYAFVLVNLVMLTLGFCLQLFGASTDAAFTRWVYRGVTRIMDPFRGMFPAHELSEQSVLDVSLLFAMIIYTIIGIALHAVVMWLTDKIVALRRHRVGPA